MGEHRPESVMARLPARIAELETRMADWDGVLSDLRAVVDAAADVKSRHFAEAAEALVPVIDDLRRHLGFVDTRSEVPASPDQPAI